MCKLQSDMLIYVPCPIHAKPRQHLGAVHVQAPAAVRNLAAPSKVAMLRIESAADGAVSPQLYLYARCTSTISEILTYSSNLIDPAWMVNL